MDKKIGNNLIVGAFVVFGFLVVVFVLFNISGGKGIFSEDYTLYATFPHVKGLNYGSEVSLMGLRAGTVKKISISEDGKMLNVHLSISKDMREKIREDSTAQIKTSGVLGDKYIELTIGSMDKPPLEDGAKLTSVETKDVISHAGDLIGNIGKQFNKGGEFDSLIHNLNLVAANLATMSKQIQQDKGLYYELAYGTSGAKLSKSLSHLEGILRKIETGEGTLGALINDPTVYEDLKAMMGGARRSSVLKYFMKQFIESGKEAEPAGPAPSPAPKKK